MYTYLLFFILGVCHMEIKLVLNELIHTKKYFKLDFFNKRVNSFKYGLTERKNKPSANFNSFNIKNTKDHKLKQKAAQTWCLVRALPFLVNDMVPDDDIHLKLISSLLHIMTTVFSPSFTLEELEYLHSIIKDHLHFFSSLFPEHNLINKHHNLLHYAESIKQNGPLTDYWCMRYEAKHYQLKQRASTCRNFKNIIKTIAEQHQIWMSYQLLYPSDRKSETTYRKGLVVCVDIDAQGMPVYGFIEELLTEKNTIICTILNSEYFNIKLNAFCVSRSKRRIEIAIKSLFQNRPSNIWRAFSSELYISPRNNFI